MEALAELLSLGMAGVHIEGKGAEVTVVVAVDITEEGTA